MPAARPAPPLPSLPVIERVRVEVAKDYALLIEDVLLPRGEYVSGDLDLFVSFGAPGAPRAFDARLFAEDAQASDATGEPIAVERAPRRPVSAQLLLGRPLMAGAVLHLKEQSFLRSVAPTGTARVRVRSMLAAPSEDARQAREIVVRLGIPEGPPLALARVELASTEPRPWITRAEAVLCGPDADPYPLSVAVTPPLAPPAVRDHAPVAPILAVRHATDDLCVRFWTR